MALPSLIVLATQAVPRDDAGRGLFVFRQSRSERIPPPSRSLGLAAEAG